MQIRQREENRAAVKPGRLPDQVPFNNLNFDLVVMTDVLEHLDRDEEALIALRNRLKLSGWLRATVPAFQWLWSGTTQCISISDATLQPISARFSNARDIPSLS